MAAPAPDTSKQSLLTPGSSVPASGAATPTAAQLQAAPSHPAAKVSTESFRSSRAKIVGKDTGPEGYFPIHIKGPVQRGFGRGGKDLGCPTANLPDESITPLSTVAKPGVYFGYAQVIPPAEASSSWRKEDRQVLPMAMSMGWNPYYKNEKLTCEIHIMHDFPTDFYGYEMRAVVLGYIRPELDYVSKELLIADIETDKQVAIHSLDRPAWRWENFRKGADGTDFFAPVDV
ncbi:riboflavin kinase [Schizophyllum commune Loenen D]|nr:riboflavin kinase [Schizophyllum commune Loenen D]